MLANADELTVATSKRNEAYAEHTAIRQRTDSRRTGAGMWINEWFSLQSIRALSFMRMRFAASLFTELFDIELYFVLWASWNFYVYTQSVCDYKISRKQAKGKIFVELLRCMRVILLEKFPVDWHIFQWYKNPKKIALKYFREIFAYLWRRSWLWEEFSVVHQAKCVQPWSYGQ